MQRNDIPVVFYQQLCDSVDFGVMVHDGGMVLDINRAFANMLGKQPESLRNKAVADILPGWHPDDEPQGAAVIHNHEITVEKPDGGCCMQITAQNITIEDKALQLITARDITQEKRAVTAFRDSQYLYRTLAESSHDAIYIITAEGYLKYINKTGASMFNATANQVVGKHITELFGHSFAKRYMAGLANVLERGESLYSESRAMFPHGPLWLDTWLTPIKGPDGRFVSVLGISRDISERKAAEASVKEAAGNYQTIFNAVNDAIIMHDAASGEILDANKKALEMYRCSLDDLKTYLPKGRFAAEPSEDANSLAMELIGKAAAGETQILEWQAKDNEGNEFWVEVNLRSATIAGRPVVLAVVRDIDDRKQEEEKLRRSELSFRTIFHSSRDAIFIHEPVSGVVLEVNDIALSMFKTTTSSLYGVTIDAFSKTDEGYTLEKATELIHRAAAGEHVLAEWRSVAADGTPFWIDVRLHKIVIDGEVRVQATVRDIDARKKAEEELRRSEEQYRQLVETSPDAIVIVGHEVTLEMVNRQAALMHGFDSPGDMMEYPGDTIDFIAPQSRDMARELLRSTEPRTAPIDQPLMLARKDGSTFPADIRVTPLPARKATLFIARDISEKLKLEEELLQAQKLESIGILAGGIAHDFNNILTAIWGNISLAKLPLHEDDDAHHRLSEAEKALTRARDLTTQLLTFSRGGSPVKKTASVAELVKESTEFALRGSNISCDFDLQSPLWPAQIDEGQISQVVNNLVINAKQAMPSGGSLHVSMRNATIHGEQHSRLNKGNYVRVAIRDTGVGIPEDILPKVFDPYFTTKPMGSGLGLATTYSIIDKHDGHIEVETKSGNGSTFTFYLPAETSRTQDKKRKQGSLWYGEGRILLMDDEADIRDVTTAQLELLGYQVDVTGDGAQAVEMYCLSLEQNQAYDVVIMDLTIPGGMGGKEAIAAIRKHNPDVKAIVFSGYFNDPVMSHYAEYGFSGVISKPYQLEELSRLIHNLTTTGNTRAQEG